MQKVKFQFYVHSPATLKMNQSLIIKNVFKVFVKYKILSVETTLSIYVHTHTVTCTQ